MLPRCFGKLSQAKPERWPQTWRPSAHLVGDVVCPRIAHERVVDVRPDECPVGRWRQADQAERRVGLVRAVEHAQAVPLLRKCLKHEPKVTAFCGSQRFGLFWLTRDEEPRSSTSTCRTNGTPESDARPARTPYTNISAPSCINPRRSPSLVVRFAPLAVSCKLAAMQMQVECMRDTPWAGRESACFAYPRQRSASWTRTKPPNHSQCSSVQKSSPRPTKAQLWARR